MVSSSENHPEFVHVFHKMRPDDFNWIAIGIENRCPDGEHRIERGYK
jgi:hypothetical protein